MPQRPSTRSGRGAVPAAVAVERLREQVRALRAERLKLQEAARVSEELQLSLEELRNQKEQIQVQNQQLAESQRLLEESRDRYADLFESAPTAFLSFDFNGVIREANAMATRLLGMERRRLLDTPLLLFVDELHRRAFLGFLHECRRGAAPCVDLALRLRDGRRIAVEFCSSGGTGVGASNVRYQVAITDLTERQHAVEVREQLRTTTESEQLLRTVVETLPVGVQVLDRAGSVVMSNAASERIWGGKAPASSDWWASLLGWWPETRAPLRADEWPVARAILQGEPVLNQLLVVEGFDRVRRTIRASALPLRNEEGLVTGAVAVCEDITALNATEAALRFSESKARQLVESNIIGVLFFDRQARITEANDAFLSLSGYTREDVHSGRVSWKDLIPADSLNRTEIAVHELHTRGSCEPFEQACLGKGGKLFYAVVGASMLEGGQEGVAFVLDLSDRRRAEEDMRQAKEAAEAANEIKDQFLSTVSHELRTPLSAVLLWAHLLRRGVLKKDRERIDALETIHQSAKAQSRLIDDLLDVSRILAGKLYLDMHPEAIGPVIEAAVNTIRPLALAKNMTVAAQLSATGTVVMDRSRIQQVVTNLLSNAVKFTSAGGRVDVRLEQGQDVMRLVVADNGIGIKADFLPHVFERFRQADATLTRLNGGLGLGLSISLELVKMHGGTIRAESPGLGHGARFTIELPLDGTGNGHAATDNMRSAMTNATLEGLHVLVVEDDRNTRVALAKILERGGAKVTLAESAARAFKLVRQCKPDLLLSDLAMPEEDGLALIRRIRADEQASAPKAGARRKKVAPLPAIALTAFAHPEDERNALDAGFHAHLAKPADPAALITLAAKIARRK